MTALDIYNQFNGKLVKKLPMNDAHFLAALTAEKLFSGDLRAEVDDKPTKAQKASHFLNNEIKPCLEDDDDVDIEPFLKLLGVMEKFSKNLGKLATRIRMQLSNVKSTPGSLSDSSTDSPTDDVLDYPDVSKLSIGVDYHRLLWQELNKSYGNASTIFVMAVGKQLSFSDYDITGNAELAAQKTFELVNSTIECATNYSPTGSSVSLMWERLLQGKGPKAGPEHRPAFEKAKSVLFKNYDQNNRTELYQDYLDKEYALKQKQLQMEDECRKKHFDQWKIPFDKGLKASKEYMEFQQVSGVVQHHLDAIKVWKDGPLVHNLNHMKQVLKENAKSVYDYSGKCLKYYHVSLQPANWYQWFGSFQHDDGQWTQIDVDSKNDDTDQATLYRKLGGCVTTYNSLNKRSDVKISFKIRAVEIFRPWFDRAILKNKNYKIFGEGPESWSTGDLDASNKGSFPLLSTQMIVAKDITVTASTRMEDKAIADACSLFGIGSKSYKTNNNSIELEGTQVIGYACTVVPKFPH